MNNSQLSSEQALDDYFTALLDDESAPVQASTDSEFELERALEPQPAVQKPSFVVEPKVLEPELPNLDDVERLLSQLENSNPVAELELEAVMESNTIQIAENIATAQVEEIQSWDIESTIVETDQVNEVLTPETLIDEQALKIEEVAEDVLPVTEEDIAIEQQTASISQETQWQCPIRDNDFQVLYFDVNGVTFAVPLDELGGIHQQQTLNHLIGRPAWYLGLQTNRDSQLDVVDTAKWVMADKLSDDDYKKSYQYIVMLDNSSWGLACTKLMGTEWLNGSKVRWREHVGKRPWLAGMVKEKMCALIHVNALIAMLNAGLDVQALDN